MKKNCHFALNLSYTCPTRRDEEERSKEGMLKIAIGELPTALFRRKRFRPLRQSRLAAGSMARCRAGFALAVLAMLARRTLASKSIIYDFAYVW